MAPDPAETEALAEADMIYPFYISGGIEPRSSHSQSVCAKLGKRKRLDAQNGRGRLD
jgi:hypothetical protein